MFSLGLSLRQIQECVICDQSVADHAEACPYRLLDSVLEQRREIDCPCCHKGRIDINTGDLYECEKCHTQFCASSLVPGEDGAALPRVVLIDGKTDSIIHVLKMKQKGEGKFKWEVAAKPLEEQIRLVAKPKRRNK